MQTNHEAPRLDITICVEPPTDNKEQDPQSSGLGDWIPEHYGSNNVTEHALFQFPQPSIPQVIPQSIPRLNTSYDDTNQPYNLWEARSPASSDSGWSNPPSPQVDQGGEEFHEDGLDYWADNRSHNSDFQYQQETFDIEQYLTLDRNASTDNHTTSPSEYFPTEYLSGPDLFPTSSSLPVTSPFPANSMPYASPYASGQASPTSPLEFSNDYSNMSQNQYQLPPGKPTHHRSSSDFLSPPSPTLSRRSHSRGHRSTISEGQFYLSPTDVNPEAPIFLGEDLRGRGLARAKSAPSAKAGSRGRSPYDRPSSQNSQNKVIPQLEIPNFSGSISDQTTPELETPSPSSAKESVATDAMIKAAEKRRKRPAKFFCDVIGCFATFTTENSRKRHVLSHSGEKPYSCSIAGCGQAFSNDDDRKRHEKKSKKHGNVQ